MAKVAAVFLFLQYFDLAYSSSLASIKPLTEATQNELHVRAPSIRGTSKAHERENAGSELCRSRANVNLAVQLPFSVRPLCP